MQQKFPYLFCTFLKILYKRDNLSDIQPVHRFKMKYSILAILIALSSVKGFNSDLNVHWENFVQKYNKNYNGQDQIQVYYAQSR